jgi:hypothetical protein
LVEAGPRLAVISADGSQCQVYASSGDNSYVAGTVTFSDGWALTREGLAAE